MRSCVRCIIYITQTDTVHADSQPFIPQSLPEVTWDWPNNVSLLVHGLTFFLEIMQFVRES